MGGGSYKNRIEYDILSVFKEKPASELSTSYIVRRVFSREFKDIDAGLNSPSQDRDMIRKAKADTARLHRKVLYYLNKLQEEDIIQLAREGSKGRKFFRLALNEGEELHLNKRVKKIVISRQESGSVPVEGYEQKSLVYRFDPATWVSRVNSILIDSARFKSLDYLHRSLVKCFSNINDVAGMLDFNRLMEISDPESFADFIEKTDSDCEDFGRTLCLIIKVSRVNKENSDRVLDCIRKYAELKPKHVRVVFDSSSKDIQQNRGFFEQAAHLFSESKIKMYIKNDSVHAPPYIIGRAGPYTFDEDDWKLYSDVFSGRMGCLVCSQASFAVDMHKLLKEYSSAEQVRSIVLKIAKSLFFSNTRQRRRSGEYFSELNRINKDHERSMFNFSRNYIRLWNHMAESPGFDSQEMDSLISQLKDDINSFCHSQETIYNAAGMPTRFRIAFSCAFDDFRRGLMEAEMFSKIIINNKEDLYKEDVSALLARKEEMSRMLLGGDRVRLYRRGSIDPKDIIREILMVANTYQLPLICYDFGDIKGANLKLNSFFD